MSDEAGDRPAPAAARTAGALLRQARQAQGLHIAALAASIKVTPRKLELLEADQIDQLPDATFARALAQTVCRALKIDAAPVLALLPASAGYRIEQVAEGLNAPFRERPGRLVPGDWAHLGGPAMWAAALVLLAAAVLYLLPPGWLSFGPPAVAPAASGGVSSSVAPLPQAVPESVFPPGDAASAAAPLAPVDAASAPLSLAIPAPAGAPGASALQLSTTAPSWVEVVDAKGASLMSRVVTPGEAVAVDGALPFKVRIGNASATRVVYAGRPLELAAYTRDNVARFELKQAKP